MLLSKKLIELEIEFAKKASELHQISVEDALLQFTSFYRTFFVPSETFDPSQEIWKRYLERIKSKELIEDTYAFYVERREERNVVSTSNYTGKSCFTYDIKEDYVTLHFENREGAHPGPLSKEKIQVRLQELRDIFKEIKEKHTEVKRVEGFSWLYSIDAYRRLFPKSYIGSAQVHNDFKSFYVWGQFLNSDESIKDFEAEKFLQDVKNAHSVKELYASFPLKPMKVKACIEDFYDFYLFK